ncbi:hypothetical protein ACWD00_38825 [Streptomyces viridiviolaceus]
MNTDELEWVLMKAERRVLEIQPKLHRWAVADSHRRFDDLFNLVADPALLLVAWDRVRGNKGARTAGVDGKTAREQGVGGLLGGCRVGGAGGEGGQVRGDAGGGRVEFGVGQAPHQEVGVVVGDLVADVLVAEHGVHEAVVALALVGVGAERGEFDDGAELGVVEFAGGEALVGGSGRVP